MTTVSRRAFFGMTTAGAALVGSAGVCVADSRVQSLSSLTKGAQPITAQEHAARVAKLQSLMQQRKVAALLVEAGSSLEYFTGIRWRRSERTTASLIPAEGGTVVVTPFFEEPSVRETLKIAAEVRPWNEDESPFELFASALRDRAGKEGPLAVEATTRFFIIDHVTKAWFVDSYTHNFDYVGTRTTGNDGGSFLVAGPNWKGETPKGVKKVLRSETEFVFAGYRTQVFNPADLENVKKIQAGYKIQPLSAFLGQPAPKAPAIEYIKPLTPAAQKTSPQFYNVLNFVLQFCPTHPSEKELMARFSRIGVGAGKTLDTSKLSPEVKTTIEQGMADAWKELAALQKRIDAKEIPLGEMFGTREYLKNNYLYRMAAAVLGIYGNSKQEAMYPIYSVDADGQKLDGTKRYALRFGPGQLPPVNAFWSLTMYDLPTSLLVANPLNRYLLNSPMLPQFKRDADAGITLLIQNESPGKDKDANWLPAPKGPFVMFMRLYSPKEEAIDGKWTAPPLKRLE